MQDDTTPQIVSALESAACALEADAASEHAQAGRLGTRPEFYNLGGKRLEAALNEAGRPYRERAGRREALAAELRGMVAKAKANTLDMELDAVVAFVRSKIASNPNGPSLMLVGEARP